MAEQRILATLARFHDEPRDSQTFRALKLEISEAKQRKSTAEKEIARRQQLLLWGKYAMGVSVGAAAVSGLWWYLVFSKLYALHVSPRGILFTRQGVMYSVLLAWLGQTAAVCQCGLRCKPWRQVLATQAWSYLGKWMCQLPCPVWTCPRSQLPLAFWEPWAQPAHLPQRPRVWSQLQL